MVREPIERLKEKVLKEKDEYAYEIRKKIKKEFGFLAGNVTGYKVLYLLEKDGYVKSYMKGRRNYYKLTEKGLKQLEKAKSFFKKVYTSI